MNHIHRIRIGFANVWLIQTPSGCILVDSGLPGKAPLLIDRIKKRGVSPQDIRLAVCTHVHFDHVGTTAALQQACGCQVLVHEKEAALLEKGRWELPDGALPVTRALVRIGRRFPEFLYARTRYQAARPDIVVSSPLSLEKWGFEARILPTPGHTEGSLSLVTTDGHGFVGDGAYNELSWLFKHRRPPFANDSALLVDSWRHLLENGVHTVHPGHGKSFPAEMLAIG